MSLTGLGPGIHISSCGKTEKGYFKIKRRTRRKNLGQSLRKFTEWARTKRNVLRKGEMLRQARTRVNWYLNYYAITDNSDRCSYYVYCVGRILFKWHRRESRRQTEKTNFFLSSGSLLSTRTK